MIQDALCGPTPAKQALRHNGRAKENLNEFSKISSR